MLKETKGAFDGAQTRDWPITSQMHFPLVKPPLIDTMPLRSAIDMTPKSPVLICITVKPMERCMCTTDKQIHMDNWNNRFFCYKKRASVEGWCNLRVNYFTLFTFDCKKGHGMWWYPTHTHTTHSKHDMSMVLST